MLNLTKGRVRVLKVFFTQPKEEIHLREIVRKSNTVPSATHEYLKEFVDRKFLQVRRVGKMKFFKPNLESKQFLKIFESFEIDELVRFKEKNTVIWKIVEEFEKKLTERIKEDLLMLVLFGSSARGDAKKTSDIDLLIVISDNSKARVESSIKKMCKEIYTYGKELSPIVISRREFREGMEADKDFFRTLWEDRIIFFGESKFWSEVAQIWRQSE